MSGRDADERAGHGGGAGAAVDLHEFEQTQRTCWLAFCFAVNHNIKENKHTGQLTINYQGRDCRIMALDPNGMCKIDVPGGEPQMVALKPDDCARLLAVACDVPQTELTKGLHEYAAGGGGQMRRE